MVPRPSESRAVHYNEVTHPPSPCCLLYPRAALVSHVCVKAISKQFHVQYAPRQVQYHQRHPAWQLPACGMSGASSVGKSVQKRGQDGMRRSAGRARWMLFFDRLPRRRSNANARMRLVQKRSTGLSSCIGPCNLAAAAPNFILLHLIVARERTERCSLPCFVSSCVCYRCGQSRRCRSIVGTPHVELFLVHPSSS